MDKLKTLWHRAPLFRRYLILFFSVLSAVCVCVSVLLLGFSAERFHRFEQENIRHRLSMAAADMETQIDVLKDVANTIRSTYAYRPSILASDAYLMIDLLEDFRRFSNYSPIFDRYFMIYSNDPERVLTSAGYISYLRFYAASTLGLSDENARLLSEYLVNTQQPITITMDGSRYLFFPIRFTGTSDNSIPAMLCFVVPNQMLLSRLHLAGGDLPSQIACSIPGETVEVPSENWLCVKSTKGQVTLWADTKTDDSHFFDDSFSRLTVWLVGLSMLLLGAALLLSILTIRPLRRIINKHNDKLPQQADELEQLDDLVTGYQQQTIYSTRMLQDKLLISVLRGYYREGMPIESTLNHVNFNYPFYCVMAVDTTGIQPHMVERITDALFTRTDDEACVYAVHVPTDDVTAVIIGFHMDSEKDQILAWTDEILGNDMRRYVGGVYSGAQRISASYAEALRAIALAGNREIADPKNFCLRLIAAVEGGNKSLQDELVSQMISQYGRASSVLVKQFATDLIIELQSLATERNLPSDKSRLHALGATADFALLMADVCAYVSDTFHREEAYTSQRYNQNADRIVAYLREHAFSADLSLIEIGEHFGISGDYVSAMVKTVTGMPFKEYLTDLRMRQACSLLITRQDLTVTQIGEQVGYRGPSNFIRKFKEVYGVTPAQYR